MCLMLIAAGWAPGARASDSVDEYRLKAAFLYNFAAFTEWPAHAPPGMRLCVIGADPFGPSLDALVGKPVRGSTVSVLRVSRPADAAQCHVVFISASERAGLGALLESLKPHPVLTVADFENAARQGVMIGLALDNRHVQFEVNADTARAGRLNVSSKLLKLARNVYLKP